MKPQNPSDEINPLDLHRSLYKTLRANISQGQVIGWASDGSPSVFQQDNTDGVLVRVAANANPLGLPNFWAGANVATVVPHHLGRVPIGYYVVKKSGTCDVYDGGGTTDTNNISLKNTVGTVDTILYIF